MTKIVSLTLIVLFVVIAIGFAVGDGPSTSSPTNSTGRSRVKSKSSLSLKKKRIGGLSRSRAEEVPNPEESATHPPSRGVDTAETTTNLDITSTEFQEPTTTPRSVKSRKSSRSQPHAAIRPPPSGNKVPEGCGECDQATCKNIPERNCYAGLVLDRCACCMVCGSGEGNRCFNSSIENLVYTSDVGVGVCGTGLDCILRKDLDVNEPLEALCECRDSRLVCGSDDRTYVSECKLREATYSNKGLSVASWGACVSAPWMPTPVENVTVQEGEDASLSCEVKGFPNPVIHWEFQSYSSNSSPKILPGDDSSVVVTVRGGPEQTMSTSWIQIIAVTNERQGTYFCVATNPKGSARSSATVTISN